MWRAVLLPVLFIFLGGFGFGQMAVATNHQNLRDCLDGFGTCDHSLLTTVQAKQIDSIHHNENLWTCTTGFGECDYSKLSQNEGQQVAALEHRRNALRLRNHDWSLR